MATGVGLFKGKKGQIETAIFIIAVIGVLVVSTFGTVQVISENRYVGDISTKLVYDLKYCDINQLLKENLVSFSDKKEAYEKGFKDATCNK